MEKDQITQLEKWNEFYLAKEKWKESSSHQLRRISEGNYSMDDNQFGKFESMNEIEDIKKLESIEILILEKFSDLIDYPNLKAVHSLYIMECNYYVYPEDVRVQKITELHKNTDKNLLKKALGIYEFLPKIKVTNLNVRFMSGHLCFFDFLNPHIKNIKLDVCYHMDDFDFSFVNKCNLIPRIEIGIFDDEVVGDILTKHIFEPPKKIPLKSGTFNFSVNYYNADKEHPEDFDDDVDMDSIPDNVTESYSLNYLPILKRSR